MLKFLCKLVNLTKSYKRKQKGMFFSEHSVSSLLCKYAANTDRRDFLKIISKTNTLYTCNLHAKMHNMLMKTLGRDRFGFFKFSSIWFSFQSQILKYPVRFLRFGFCTSPRCRSFHTINFKHAQSAITTNVHNR